MKTVVIEGENGDFTMMRHGKNRHDVCRYVLDVEYAKHCNTHLRVPSSSGGATKGVSTMRVDRIERFGAYVGS